MTIAGEVHTGHTGTDCLHFHFHKKTFTADIFIAVVQIVELLNVSAWIVPTFNPRFPNDLKLPSVRIRLSVKKLSFSWKEILHLRGRMTAGDGGH